MFGDVLPNELGDDVLVPHVLVERPEDSVLDQPERDHARVVAGPLLAASGAPEQLRRREDERTAAGLAAPETREQMPRPPGDGSVRIGARLKARLRRLPNILIDDPQVRQYR